MFTWRELAKRIENMPEKEKDTKVRLFDYCETANPYSDLIVAKGFEPWDAEDVDSGAYSITFDSCNNKSRGKMDTYKGYVSYDLPDGGKCVCEHGGFSSVKDATEWVSGIITNIMLNWGKINENGLDVHAEVCDEGSEGGVGFTDTYDLSIGI